MKTVVRLIPALAVFAMSSMCLAEDAGDRDKLWGTWKTDGSGGSAETWILARQDDGTVRVTLMQGDQKALDYECNTVGKDCKTKAEGRDAIVSMYFNGSRLVQWEKGKEVVKRRFEVASDGSTLQVESDYIVPDRKPETVKLKRAEAPQSVQTAKQ